MRHPTLRNAAIFQPEELSDSPRTCLPAAWEIQIEEQERKRAHALKSAKRRAPEILPEPPIVHLGLIRSER